MVVPGKLVPLLLLAGALSLSAQEAAPGVDVEVEVGETIDVRVVNVEAVVTDRSGERVRGLNPADFRLLVDGKEVPIDYFTEIRGGAAVAAGAEGGGPPAPAAGVVGRNLLVFVDQSFTVQSKLDLVLRELREDLDRLGPEDRVAVVAGNAEGRLKILTDWTSDVARLRTALDQIRSEPTTGLHYYAALDSLDNDRALERTALIGHDRPGSVGSDFGQWWDLRSARQPVWLSSLESYSAAERGAPELWAEDELGTTVLAAMRSFSSAPGRKVMLLVSGGWPAGQDPRVTEAANLFGYSLYPVDVSGLQTSPVPVGASQMGPAAPNAQYSGFISSAWERRVHYGYEVLARETGGKASLNGLRETALERTLDDTSSYYWLGFSPTWKADGRKHKIRLKVRQSGLDVRARRGYSDLSLQAQEALEAESRRVIEAAAGSSSGSGAR